MANAPPSRSYRLDSVMFLPPRRISDGYLERPHWAHPRSTRYNECPSTRDTKSWRPWSLEATRWSTGRREFTRRVGCVSLADHSVVLLRQEEDECGRGQGAELERDEHEVPAMDGKRADQQAAHEPHGPGAAADTRRAVCLAEMDYLRNIGEHRDRNSGDTEGLKHGSSYSSSRRCRAFS